MFSEFILKISKLHLVELRKDKARLCGGKVHTEASYNAK